MSRYYDFALICLCCLAINSEFLFRLCFFVGVKENLENLSGCFMYKYHDKLMALDNQLHSERSVINKALISTDPQEMCFRHLTSPNITIACFDCYNQNDLNMHEFH